MSEQERNEFYSMIIKGRNRTEEEETPMEQKLYKAAQAFKSLNVCYRLGKIPSEKLFRELSKAEECMLVYEGKSKAKVRK